MAAVSFYSTRDGGFEQSNVAGADQWTQGSSAPGSGDIEIRLADGVAWTRDELKQKVETFYQFLLDNGSTAYPI